MVKLIRRNLFNDEASLYLTAMRGSGWRRDDGLWPRGAVNFTFPHRTTTETINLDYFDQGATSAAGLDMDVVQYQRPGSLVVHTYNPVTHYKLSGAVLADEDSSELESLADNELNLFSGKNTIPMISVSPGEAVHDSDSLEYYSDWMGTDTYFEVGYRVERSHVHSIMLYTPDGVREKSKYTLITYTLYSYLGRKSQWHEPYNNLWVSYGCFVYFSGNGKSGDYNRNRLWYLVKSDSGWKYSSRDAIKANVRRYTTEARNYEVEFQHLLRNWRPGIDEPYYLSTESSYTIGDFRFRSSYVRTGRIDHSAVDALKSWNWNDYTPMFTEERPKFLWNKMAYSALQDIGDGAQVNGIAYVKDAIEMGPTVKAFISTLKSVPSKKVKAIASAWLAAHYGFKLTIMDTKELYEELTTSKHNRFALSNARSKRNIYLKGGYHAVYRYQIIYDRYRNLTDVLNGFLRSVDLVLDLQNIWDMIPFSFVVDWFTSLGDMLNALDGYYNVRSYYTTAAAGQSISIKGPAFGRSRSVTDSGSLKISMYKRGYKRTPEIPVPGFTSVTPLSHWIEGAALIIANR